MIGMIRDACLNVAFPVKVRLILNEFNGSYSLVQCTRTSLERLKFCDVWLVVSSRTSIDVVYQLILPAIGVFGRRRE